MCKWAMIDGAEGAEQEELREADRKKLKKSWVDTEFKANKPRQEGKEVGSQGIERCDWTGG